jgi:hypothetical protein
MVRQGWRSVAHLRPAGAPPPTLLEWRQPLQGQLNDSW